MAKSPEANNLPSISLCMIVRNEAGNIRYCLDSARGAVDEIIIVDTGSTDNTVDICREYTDKIYHFDWSDDFSAARNESLKYATKDWILILDGDEVLYKTSSGKLKKLLSAQPPNAGVLYPLIYNIAKENLNQYLAQKNLDLKKFSCHQHSRLLRNHTGIKFKYSLHEFLDPQDYVPRDIPLNILHYGYQGLSSAHFQRNLQCLQKDIRLYPNDIAPQVALARTYLGLNRAAEYIKLMEQVVAKYTESKIKIKEIELSYIYQSFLTGLLHLKEYALAKKYVSAWLNSPKGDPDLRADYYLGKLLYAQENYPEALVILEPLEAKLKGAAVKKRYPAEFHQMQREVCFYLGAIYLFQKKYAQALKYLSRVKKMYLPGSAALDKMLNIAVQVSPAA